MRRRRRAERDRADDHGAVLHNVTFADNVSASNRATGTFQRTFTTAGTYSYRCTLHAGMTGTVTVQ